MHTYQRLLGKFTMVDLEQKSTQEAAESSIMQAKKRSVIAEY